MINSVSKVAIINANILVGTKEEKQNRGEVIDKIQKEFGFIGLPYCVLFTLYCYKRACAALDIPFPFPNTASSQTLFEWAKKNNFTFTDPQLVRPGDIVIWRKFKLWSGHAGLIVSTLLTSEKGILFETIEGNTSNNDFGNQRDGDGIYRRRRYANKIDFDVDGFYLRGFISAEKVFSPFTYDASRLT